MTSTYAVQVECSNGGEDGAAYRAVLDALDEKVVDAIVREDGSAVFWLSWEPESEDAEGGAATWQAAKGSVEHIRSTFAGHGVLVSELRVGEHDVSELRRTKSKKAAK